MQLFNTLQIVSIEVHFEWGEIDRIAATKSYGEMQRFEPSGFFVHSSSIAVITVKKNTEKTSDWPRQESSEFVQTPSVGPRPQYNLPLNFNEMQDNKSKLTLNIIKV